MWGTAFERYGKTFLETFERFWPQEVELIVVADRDYGAFCKTRARFEPMQDIEGYEDFLSRWGANPAARGQRPPKTAKRDANGYSWRFDAVKWMPQALAPVAALEGMRGGDLFLWLDADVQTETTVPASWLGDRLAGTDVACLQRPGTHSEIGFYLMRISPSTIAVLERFAALYRTDQIFALKETHSAFAFDHALAAQPGLTIRNLNPKMVRGHCWPFTELAEHLTHLKGKRKNA